MSPEEQEALRRCLDAISATNVAMTATVERLGAVERQILLIATAIHSMNRRLQLQEAGTALYEVAEGIPKEAH